MDDIKITRICNKLNIKEFTQLKYKKNYLKLQNYLSGLSPSTAEDYIWRLHRALAKTENISVTCLKKYAALLKKYKKIYL